MIYLNLNKCKDLNLNSKTILEFLENEKLCIEDIQAIIFCKDNIIEDDIFTKFQNLIELIDIGKCKSICDHAFENCHIQNNIQINIDENISIGNSCFKNTDINKLTIISQNKNYVFDIPESFAENCKNLETIEFPDCFINIGKNAFKNCTKLTTIENNQFNSSDRVKSIGAYSFENCPLSGELWLDNNPNTIFGKGCFKNTRYSKLVFCSQHDNTILIPEEFIEGDLNLKVLRLPYNKLIIGKHAFKDTNIENTDFYINECSIIGYNAFKNTKIWPTANQKEIFQLNNKVIVHTNDKDQIDDDYCEWYDTIDNQYDPCKLTLYSNNITREYIDNVLYINDLNINDINSIQLIEDSTSIYDNALSGFSNLSNIIGLNKAIHVGSNAFNGCYKLESLDFTNCSSFSLSSFNNIGKCNNGIYEYNIKIID